MRFAKIKSAGHPPIVRSSRLRIGFIPTLDCATLIAAQELGLFTRHGLDVRLSREVGWATIREKLLHEELDAVATHASMLFTIYCGLGVVRRPCLTGLMLGSNGSAITLSRECWNLGVRDAATLGAAVRRLAPDRVFTFGAVLEHSTQHHLLRSWLLSAGLVPGRDVRIVIIPSELIYETFAAGFLDGYCVAEPWNSAAVLNRTGWIVATSGALDRPHPEKVLLVLQEFVDTRPDEHLQLLAALMEASVFCEDPGHRRELVRLLAQPRYFDVPADYLANALVGPFDPGLGSATSENLIAYDARKVGRPDRASGRWVLDLVRTLSGPAENALKPEMIGKVFRCDLYEQARQLAHLPPLGTTAATALAN
jgi:ABC-type nitrate/sulfonate/bicarbonate transport system substrate-binding protein